MLEFLQFVAFLSCMFGLAGLLFFLSVMIEQPTRRDAINGLLGILAGVVWPVTIAVFLCWYLYKAYYIIRYDRRPTPRLWFT